MSLVRNGLLSIKALAEIAAAKVEEAEKRNLANQETGSVDSRKAAALIAEQEKQLARAAAAIDQLQQRVSNLEATQARFEVLMPPKRSPVPPTGGVGWIEDPTQ